MSSKLTTVRIWITHWKRDILLWMRMLMVLWSHHRTRRTVGHVKRGRCCVHHMATAWSDDARRCCTHMWWRHCMVHLRGIGNRNDCGWYIGRDRWITGSRRWRQLLLLVHVHEWLVDWHQIATGWKLRVRWLIRDILHSGFWRVRGFVIDLHNATNELLRKYLFLNMQNTHCVHWRVLTARWRTSRTVIVIYHNISTVRHSSRVTINGGRD